MPKKDLTEIIVVLDRSGSMFSIKADMDGAFDSFVAEQRKLPGQATLTLVQFDDVCEQVYGSKPLSDVPPMALTPRGSTALYDAIGKTISETGARLKGLPEAERPERVLFLVITDGHENASREYTQPRIAEMVKHQTDKYSWCFVYLGANQDAVMTGKGIGIGIAENFAANSVGTKSLMANVSHSTRSYRGGKGYV